MMDPIRRNILATGAAAATMAAAPGVFAQQTGGEAFYEKGPVRIHYEEAGSGFPLLLIAGGGLNSTISFFTQGAPFNAIEEFKGEYRCITSDLRNANGGQSSGRNRSGSGDLEAGAGNGHGACQEIGKA